MGHFQMLFLPKNPVNVCLYISIKFIVISTSEGQLMPEMFRLGLIFECVLGFRFGLVWFGFMAYQPLQVI